MEAEEKDGRLELVEEEEKQELLELVEQFTDSAWVSVGEEDGCYVAKLRPREDRDLSSLKEKIENEAGI